jgi:acyl dehydratase
MLSGLKRTVVSSCGFKLNGLRALSNTRTFEITGSLLHERNPKVGMYSEVSHVFSQEDVNVFANLCGDNNPLHSNPEFAKTTIFKGTIVHGIFVSSLFSTIFGRSVAGSIYVSQNLSFKRPVHVGVPVKARIEVLSLEDKRKGMLMTCITTCSLEDGTTAVTGEAKVLLPYEK